MRCFSHLQIAYTATCNMQIGTTITIAKWSPGVVIRMQHLHAWLVCSNRVRAGGINVGVPSLTSLCVYVSVRAPCIS